MATTIGDVIVLLSEINHSTMMFGTTATFRAQLKWMLRHLGAAIREDIGEDGFCRLPRETEVGPVVRQRFDALRCWLESVPDFQAPTEVGEPNHDS